ncbi:MAG TPA: Na/Pi cotransporter family protein [Mesorhizobium sp.]|jgi:phosphate:Na+ symporter|nr:Na/Pi cotransporter family protein [Mesorhizobium sp.]
MSGSAIILNLAGAVALLLVAVRMVRTAVERAFGPQLRRRMRPWLDRAPLALATGAALALAFQSATAVMLLVGALAAGGGASGTAALLAVLGADVGSALAVVFLSLDVEWLAPGFLLLGAILFLGQGSRSRKQLGRALVGVGLILLSLRLIGEASSPLRESAILPPILIQAAGDPVAGFMAAAALTVAFHSSVAALLLFAALAHQGLVPDALAVALVLGANLGGGLVGILVTRTAEPTAREAPLGNLLLRGAGAALGLVGLMNFPEATGWLAPLSESAATRMVTFHLLFNLAVVLCGTLLAPLVVQAVRHLLARPAASAQEEVTALDESALGLPKQALSNARREAVGMCDTLEAMLAGVGRALGPEADRDAIAAIRGLDHRLDARHRGIKLYLARLGREQLTAEEQAERQELMEACVRLEQAGDVIVRGLLSLAEKKFSRGLSFTSEGAAEIAAFHGAVLANARLAFTLLVSRDVAAARRLMEEKERLREREAATSQKHFGRLAEGARESLDTSAIHLDAIRDLKQINGLLAALAHPILDEHGLLRRSRLKAR